MRVLTRLMLAAVALGALAAAQGQSRPDLQLKAAVYKETVEGDLKGAADLYRQVASNADAPRQVAAAALLGLGGCYEKLGQQDARKVYERLVAEFSDQAREVAEARQRLTALQPPAAVPGRSEMTARRVLAIEGRGLGVDAAIDARATFFSFTDVETGDLAIMALPGGSKRRLTNKGPWTVASPEFTQVSVPSPDGRKVAYDWWTKDGRPEMRVIGLDGSAPQVIHNGEDISLSYPCDWSPDGQRVLAVFVLKDDRTNQIVLLSVADGPKRVVTTIPGALAPVHRARFSPDGRYIAFDQRVQGSKGSHDIFVVAAEGSRPTPLLQEAADDRLLGWSPDGRHILFSSDRTGTTDAWLLPVADGKPDGAPQLIKRDLGYILPLGFAQNGSFYYNLGMGGWDVYVAGVDPASGKVVVAPRLVPERFLGSNVSPEWSPDGRSLFWLSRRGTMGPARNIPRVRSMETGEERDLVTGLLALIQVTWSRDGRSLLGVCIDRAEQRGICRIDVQTGQATTLLVDGPRDVHRVAPVGLPDGKHILFGVNTPEGRAGGYGVVLIRNLDTGEEREVARSAGRFSVSPDGRQLAFPVADEAAKEGVVSLVPVAGGEPRELFRTKKTGMSVSWTADGKHVVVGESDQDNEVLWKVPVDGGKPLKFTLGTKGVLGPRLHPDGRQVAFYTRLEGKGEVWVMENFLPPAKPKPPTAASQVSK